MRTIEQIKSAGRFYKAGSIIPERVLSIRPKHKRHLVKFGSDCWVLGVSKSGSMVIAMDCRKTWSAVSFPFVKCKINACGGKYVRAGTVWIGNSRCNDTEWSENIENALLK